MPARAMKGRRAITSSEMYRIEENGDSKLGMKRFLMMENAGHGAADYIVENYGKDLEGKKIVAVCGTGNNGGDGFVISRHLAGRGARVTVILLGQPTSIRSEEAKMNWSILEKMKESVEILLEGVISEEARRRIRKADVIVDAIFGTGLKGEIKDPFSTAIDSINHSKAYVLAVDVPSGLDPDTGKPISKSVKADATVTFHRLKAGMKKGKKYTGKVHVEHIGIPPEAERGIVA